MDNQIIHGSLKNEQELKEKLSLLAPSKFLNSNSILEFERYKDIQVDWLDLLNIENNDKNIELNFKDYIHSLKDYFCKYWDNKKSYKLFNSDKDNFQRDFENLTLSVLEYDTTDPDKENKNYYWKKTEIGYWSTKSSKIEFEKDTFCIIHYESKRLYYFSTKNDEVLSITDLGNILNVPDISTLRLYDFWNGFKESRLNVNICFEKDNTKNEDENRVLNKYFFPTSSIIDRNLIFYREEFFKLDIEFSFIEKVKTSFEFHQKDAGGANLPSKLDDIVRNYSNTLDQEQLNIAKTSYFEIINRGFELKNLLDNIKNKIESNGVYKLNLEDGATIYAPDGITPVATITNVKRGDIIQYEQKLYTYSKVTSWKERVCTKRITIPMPWPLSDGNVCVEFGDENRFRTDIIQGNLDTPVKADLTDPLENFKTQVRKSNKNVKFYSCVKTNDGYVSDYDGTPLKNILKRCEDDEAFRLNCIIITYRFDFILTEKKYPVDANVFFFPLPSMFSQNLPQLKIRETLAYRIAWEGAELGQLVNSINLAPGESRQISLSTSFTQNTTKSNSLKSSSDTNASNSFDLSSELQNEATKEMSKTDSFSAEVSGSYGGFVSGGASGSTTSNIKTFTRDMSKLAKKTSSSINRRLVSEVNETSSQSITINQSSSRTSSISNINQGSTLNLMIYQINNRFKSGLFVDDIYFSIVNNNELIPSSGLFDLTILGFHSSKQYVNKIMDNLDNLLIDKLDTKERLIISNKLVSLIEDVINEDYLPIKDLIKIEKLEYKKSHNNFSNKEEKNESISRLKKLYGNRKFTKTNEEKQNDNEIGNFKEDKLNFENEFSLVEEKIKSSLNEYDNVFKSKEIVGKNLFDNDDLREESLFTINSSAFFIDSIVGKNPATEAYSDDMRTLEKNKIESLISEQKIKNQLLQKGLPYIIKISNDINLKKSTLHLSCPIMCKCFLNLFCNCSKHFKVYLDNFHIIDSKVYLSKDKFYIEVYWSKILPEVDELENQLEVVYKNNVIKYLK